MTVIDRDFRDLFFCRCTKCRTPMTLAREVGEGRYYAVCELCRTMQPLSDSDQPPMEAVEAKDSDA